MLPRRPRAIPLTIIMGTLSVLLSIAMIVAWTLLIANNIEVSEHVARHVWLLVAGLVSLVVIIAVLVLFSVLLVREIRSGRRQTTFIDSVTHELKSPLASLRLGLETLERRKLAPAQRASVRQMMLSDVERLSAFIDDILAVSRLTRGRMAVRHTDVELAPLARRCAERVMRLHSTPAEAVEVDVPAGLSLATDPTALETVLANLLDNAIKYSDSPEGVMLVAGTDAAGVWIEVRDRGIGVPRDQLKRIFERFYRAPGEQVRARRGTGIGLFVVWNLVRLLGGRVEATSEGPGRGTTIRITLQREAPTNVPVTTHEPAARST